MTFFLGAALVAIGAAVGVAVMAIASRRGWENAYKDGYDAGYDEGSVTVAMLYSDEGYKGLEG